MRKNFGFVFATFFVVFLLFVPPTLALEVPPEWKYKKIKTPHFDIIYNSAQQDLGELYARHMERAFTLLSPVFTTQPERTLVIINDKTDATNGYATRIPYPHIVTYPVLPGPQESLSESGDWALELLAHEYTHILNFEPATGVFSVLRGVLGSIASPNLLLPTWWKEGLAVQTESMLGPQGGRLKSLYQEAVLRAMVEEKSLLSFDIAQVNEHIPTWPEGMRPYLFGSLFWSQAVSDYGPSIMNDLNQRHGGRIPYLIEAPAFDLLKDSYEGFYKKALNETHSRAQSQLEKLRSQTPSEIRPLSLGAKYSSAPAISANGQYLALITVDYKADRGIEILVRDPETKLINKKFKIEIKKEDDPPAPGNDEGPPSGSIQKLAWFHKSPKLIYDQLRYINRTERYSDLHTYDLKTGKSEKLTSGLRGREPSVSPNDDQVVFVKLEGGRTALGLYDLTNKKTDLLYRPEIQERISSPIFLNADTVIFALRNVKGEEGLWLYSLKEKTVQPILTQFQQARFPVLTKLGLMFTASNNGVHNLYLASADFQSAKPLTHVTTMVSSAAFDPNSESLYVTYMGSMGPRVGYIRKETWSKTSQELPRIEGLFADRYKNLLTSATPADTEPSPAATPYEITDYSPWGYMWPRYWIPYLWTSPEGGMVFQAQTSGHDPLKKHNYDVVAGWNTFLRAFDWSAAYLNNITNNPFQIAAAQSHSYLATRENLVKDSLAALSISPDLWSFSDKLTASLGWRYLERSYLLMPSLTKRTGPYAGLVYKNFTQGGEQFTPQSGGGAYINAVNYIPGRDLMTHSQFQAGGVYYFSKFLPKLHAIMIRTSLLYTPEKISSLYGALSDSMDYFPQDLSAKFLARGYLTGQFLGRNMYNANLEYRLNLSDMYQGRGTYALFLRRLSAALTADAISTDGRAYNPVTQNYNDVVHASDIFWSYGVEAHLETTVGYEFPLSFVLGVYQGANKKYAPDPTVGLAIQFAGF